MKEEGKETEVREKRRLLNERERKGKIEKKKAK